MRGLEDTFPTLILEPNALAGWANRYLGKYVSKICVSYPKMERFFPEKKLLYTGTPLRASLHYAGTAEDARRHFGLEKDRSTLLVVGGSLGADTFNRCMMTGWRQLLERRLSGNLADRYFALHDHTKYYW